MPAYKKHDHSRAIREGLVRIDQCQWCSKYSEPQLVCSQIETVALRALCKSGVNPGCKHYLRERGYC
jgi:hypothetical protein